MVYGSRSTGAKGGLLGGLIRLLVKDRLDRASQAKTGAPYMPSRAGASVPLPGGAVKT